MQYQKAVNLPYTKQDEQEEIKMNQLRHGSKKKGAREILEMAMHAIFLLCGTVAVAFVLLISVYLILSGLPAIREIGLVDFLFGQTWAPTNQTNPAYGILPFILTSIYGTAGAVLIGVPVGLMTAVFLSKSAPPKLAAVIHTAVELLAGIPSVVYGLVGMIVLVPAIRNLFHLSSGASLLAAIIVLAIMILPSIINVSENALNAVPKEPLLRWVRPKSKPSSRSASRQQEAESQRQSCWVWAERLERQWQLSWYREMWQICRACSPRCAS